MLESCGQATLWLRWAASVRCEGCVSAWIWPAAPASASSRPLLGAWITWSCRDCKDRLSVREESEWGNTRERWGPALTSDFSEAKRTRDGGRGLVQRLFMRCLLPALQWDSLTRTARPALSTVSFRPKERKCSENTNPVEWKLRVYCRNSPKIMLFYYAIYCVSLLYFCVIWT